MTTPYNYVNTYTTHTCLYNTPIDCSASSISTTQKTFGEIKNIYGQLNCSLTTDNSACFYVINNVNDALEQMKKTMGNSEINKQKQDLDKSIHQLKDITDGNYPHQELYNVSIATSTAWLILGTTMLFYVFKNL